jgi:hypothetical protein
MYVCIQQFLALRPTSSTVFCNDKRLREWNKTECCPVFWIREGCAFLAKRLVAMHTHISHCVGKGVGEECCHIASPSIILVISAYTTPCIHRRYCHPRKLLVTRQLTPSVAPALHSTPILLAHCPFLTCTIPPRRTENGCRPLLGTGCPPPPKILLLMYYRVRQNVLPHCSASDRTRKLQMTIHFRRFRLLRICLLVCWFERFIS